MRSYTSGRNLAGTWTKNTDTTNLSYLDGVANDDYRHICALKDWPFLERNRSISTTASTQFTTLPYDCDQVREISVIPTGSTTRYTPTEITSRSKWDDLNLVIPTSNIPEYYYVFAGQVGLWPTPSSTGNTIYVTQKTRVIDLSVADITTSTVTSITSGTTAMVISGGGNALMAGMWIRVTYTPGTSNTGDGVWYEISAATATTITLVRAYGGTTISAGTAACTIAQMPLLPEAFHDLPWLWAAGTYWQKEDDERAKGYFDQHGSAGQGGGAPTGRVKELINAWSSESTDMVIDMADDEVIINPNLTISL
jgi:hypothetical protein